MYRQCPMCRSHDIEIEGHPEDLSYQCQDCGYYWRDSDGNGGDGTDQ